MKPSLYSITALSNLHAGSGDANYGIIDKLVQRDSLNNLPVVHASSLKGAILQHFFHQADMTDAYIDKVFGGQNSPNKRKDNMARDGSKSGEFVFMQAQLLSLPVRSNKAPFFRVSSPGILKELRNQLLNTGLIKKDNNLIQGLDNLIKQAASGALGLDADVPETLHLEDIKNLKVTKVANDTPGLAHIKSLLDSPAILLDDAAFGKLCDNHHLPVIARNHLENGQSTNLWYEQVLPRQSRFWFMVLQPENYSGDFDARLTKKGMVQIGANASVGYGFCNIKLEKLTENENQPAKN